MISISPIRLLPCAFAGLLGLLPLAAQEPDTTLAGTPEAQATDDSWWVKTHRFGASEEGEPGFEVVFDLRGAGVRSVKLLDERASNDDPDVPYTLVFAEEVLPGRPGSDVVAWLRLREETTGDLFPALAETGGLQGSTWLVAEESASLLRFTLDCGNGVTIERVYRYDSGRRDLGMEIALRADADRQAQDVGSRWVLQMDGVGLSTPRSEYIFGSSAALAMGRTSIGEEVGDLVTVKATGKPMPEMPVLAQRLPGGSFDFAGSTNRFFGAFLYPDPQDPVAMEGLELARMMASPTYEQLDTAPLSVPFPRYWLSLPVPAAGEETRAHLRLYMGPKSFRVFEENSEYERFDVVMENALNPACFCSVPGARTLAGFLLGLLGFLEGIIGNWGFAIVVMTILVRGSLVPLNFRMQKSMRAYGARMAKVKPKMEALQKLHANDKQRLQQEMVAFQREHKLFPPLGGCLPMFVTIPVFIGLFTALRVSYDLRLEPFLFWIDDLSKPDALFSLEFLGWDFLPTFNLLPLLMVFLWWRLQANTPLPKDPQQRQMMKIMRFMPLMFGVMLYKYASGLMVYMITSSIFGLIEQRVTRKILGPVDPDAAGVGGMAPMI